MLTRAHDQSQSMNPAPPTIRASVLCLLTTSLVFSQVDELSQRKLVDHFRSTSKLSSGFRPTVDVHAFEFLERVIELRNSRQWIEFFRTIDEMPAGIRNRLVTDDGTTWISVGSYCRRLIRNSEPEGVEQMRVYVDGAANKAFHGVRNSTDTRSIRRLFDRYFFSSFGDRLANELANVRFQNGEFREAAELWERVLREYPETDLSPAGLLTKQAFAWFRANEQTRFATVASQIEQLPPNTLVTVGGEQVPPLSVVKQLQASFHISKTGTRQTVDLKAEFDSLDNRNWSTFWSEMRQDRDMRIRSFAANHRTCVVSLGNAAAAFDYVTGKLKWTHRAAAQPKSESASNVPKGGVRIFRNQTENARRFLKVALRPTCNSDTVFVISQAEPRDANFAVVHAIDDRSGKTRWISDVSQDNWQFVSNLISTQGVVWGIGHNLQSDQMTLFGLSAKSGAVLAALPLGRVFTATEYGRSNVFGNLILAERRLYVALPGALAAVDLEDRTVLWLYRLSGTSETGLTETKGRSQIRNIFLNDQKPVLVSISKGRIFIGQTKQVVCLDRHGKPRWQTDDAKYTHFVGNTPARLFALTTDHLVAIDASTGETVSQRYIPNHFSNGSMVAQRLVIPGRDGLHLLDEELQGQQLVLTPFEIGPIQQVVTNGDQFAAIGRQTVTLFPTPRTIDR